jgi:hypothetical protein
MSFGEPGLPYITKQICIDILDLLEQLDDDSQATIDAFDFFAEILGADLVL